jgi:hypothetical protein
VRTATTPLSDHAAAVLQLLREQQAAAMFVGGPGDGGSASPAGNPEADIQRYDGIMNQGVNDRNREYQLKEAIAAIQREGKLESTRVTNVVCSTTMCRVLCESATYEARSTVAIDLTTSNVQGGKVYIYDADQRRVTVYIEPSPGG